MPNSATDEDLRERPKGQWWQSIEPMVEVSYERVRGFGLAALQAAGASAQDAEFLLSVPMDKSVQGDHARGIDGLGFMLRAAKQGLMGFAAEPTTLRETASTALMDGTPSSNKTLLCRAAMDLAIAKARHTGIGWVSLRFPAGILTPHLMQAVEAGMVGMVMTQSYPMVAPHGGFVPMFGNAPVGFGIPAGERDPVIFDASLTQTSASGVKLAAMQGQQVPEGFLLDAKGEPTTNAAAFPAAGHLTHDTQRAAGTLLPLGASHKAYGLIFIVTLLTAVLADSDAPWDVGDVVGGRPAADGEHYGSTYMAIDPAAFLDPQEFRRRVDAFIDGVKASPARAGGEVLYPGEGSQRLRRERREAGTFLMPESHARLLTEVAGEYGLRQFLPLEV